jgi:hypothetical protein
MLHGLQHVVWEWCYRLFLLACLHAELKLLPQLLLLFYQQPAVLTELSQMLLLGKLLA